MRAPSRALISPQRRSIPYSLTAVCFLAVIIFLDVNQGRGGNNARGRLGKKEVTFTTDNRYSNAYKQVVARREFGVPTLSPPRQLTCGTRSNDARVPRCNTCGHSPSPSVRATRISFRTQILFLRTKFTISSATRVGHIAPELKTNRYSSRISSESARSPRFAARNSTGCTRRNGSIRATERGKTSETVRSYRAR